MLPRPHRNRRSRPDLGQQIQAAVPQSPFTAGIPFASGQQITVSVPANTILPHATDIHIVECEAGPGGAPPTGTWQCDNNTQYYNTVVVNSDGSINIPDATVYALPSVALGESAKRAHSAEAPPRSASSTSART